jgi:hypothetical protein
MYFVPFCAGWLVVADLPSATKNPQRFNGHPYWPWQLATSLWRKYAKVSVCSYYHCKRIQTQLAAHWKNKWLCLEYSW